MTRISDLPGLPPFDPAAQVIVNVAELQPVILWVLNQGALPKAILDAANNLVLAIPEPEWEPTNEQVAQYKRAQDVDHAQAISHLKAMHREGLL